MKSEFEKALKKLQEFQLKNFAGGSIDIKISRVPHEESHFHSIRVDMFGADCGILFSTAIFDTGTNASIKKQASFVLHELAKHNPATPTKAISDLKKGDLFRLKDSETAPVWVRGEYIPSERKYSTYKYDDVNHERFVPGKVEVFTDFTY